MVEILDGTGHVLAGRIMSYREQPCPCVYVFYNKSSFEDDQRGLMYHLQDHEDGNGYEIVFRMWRSEPPLPNEEWLQLSDDRYKVCSASDWRWRAFQVRSSSDKLRARELVFAAKARFEEIFSIAIGNRDQST
jgi:hypothetical protein